MRHWLTTVRNRLTVMLLVSLVVGLLIPVSAFADTGINHAVTFAENANGSDSVVASQTSSIPAALTQFANLAPAFSKSGFTFAGWNTSASGGGTSYGDGATYAFTSDIILYAQWAAPFKAVTFSENDNSLDGVVAEETGNSSLQLTSFAALSPSFSNPGHAFASWNTAANGSGTTYADGAQYSFAADLTLYAEWTVSSNTLSFSPNGGTGSIAPILGASGSSVTLPGGGALLFTGSTFVDWNTSADGTGATYNAGSTFSINAAATLYAQWTANSTTPPTSTTTIVITLNGGSGTGSLTPVSLAAGSTVILPSSAGLSKPGYTFSGWYTAASGGTFLGLPGASFIPTSSVVIFAQWTVNPTVTLKFSSNHGAGLIVAESGLEGATIILPAATRFTYAGYSFAGWNTTSDASGTSYSNRASFTLSTSMTLYAQWSPQRLGKSQSLLLGAIGPFTNGSSQLTTPLKLQVRRIAVAMKSKDYSSASLFGYATESGSPALNLTLSAKRALSVVAYLRAQLVAIHAKKVTMRSSGEGSIKGLTIAMFRRVEVFVR